MKYAVTIEKTSTGCSAYPPDIPGVGVAADTPEADLRLVREAIAFHIEGLMLQGRQAPEPSARSEYLDVPISA